MSVHILTVMVVLIIFPVIRMLFIGRQGRINIEQVA